MSKRWWLLGSGLLILIGLLVACSATYNSSSDGLLLVTSQGSGLIETFSFNLSSGGSSAIANTPIDTSSEVCVLNGIPSSVVLDPAGKYAYTLLTQVQSICPGSATGILASQVSGGGNITTVGNIVTLNPLPGNVPVVPNAMTMDSTGKFLFVADLATSTSSGAISVLAIGSGGSLTEVPGSPFVPGNTGIVLMGIPNIVAVAASPTVFPATGINGVQYSVCSVGQNPPTSEFLYAVDAENYLVWGFQVNLSTGVLTAPSPATQTLYAPTDPVPMGVAVDPCDRFVYVSDNLTAKVSAYAICDSTPTSPSQQCMSQPPGTLIPVPGSPFPLSGAANGPGPIIVDPYGNNVYVVGLLSNTVSPLKISPVNGSLSALNPPIVATGAQPKAITIRGDDSWMFVSNFSGLPPSVSQYSIAPATGNLTTVSPIYTDNYPWGVAVK
ncbi:MAG TPA: beta-propeller fold lactonase family protein [Candidatus Sulfotelmatobacter sp.]|nr:beta-propeller fold lactonase family protein [Candidatus Sulfotelmatobacter sp.]